MSWREGGRRGEEKSEEEKKGGGKKMLKIGRMAFKRGRKGEREEGRKGRRENQARKGLIICYTMA